MPRGAAKDRTVGDVRAVDEVHGLLVEPDTPVREVVSRLSRQPTAGVVFVVDEDRTLLGVLTRRDLLSWAGLQVGVDVAGERVRWMEVLDVARARTAGDLLRRGGKPLSVRMDDSLETALVRMLRQDVADLPVVDGDGRVVGGVRLSELLEAALEAAED